jgi:hypothetical protein
MKKLIGGILMAIGILIAGASGLCSLVFAIGGLSGGGAELLPLVLVIGGVPFAIGFGMAALGRSLIKAVDRESEG